MDEEKISSALACVCAVAASLGTAAKAEELRKIVQPEDEASLIWLEKAVEHVKLKSRVVRATADELPHLPIPMVALLQNGRCIVVGKHYGNRLIILDPDQGRPATIPQEAFLEAWTGDLLLISRPFTWKAFKTKYHLDWFLPIIVKFKHLFYEVTAASFFLQFFGLMTPLFTQVIIDKVVVNKGEATLDVLAILLLVLGLFQSGMTILRTYVLTHTTMKLDAYLGTRMFRHLVALPIPFFENSRVGNLMIMVNCLNGVRDFLTGTTLTALLDVFFTFVFVGVMFYYSVPLTLIALAVIPIYFLQAFITTPIFRRRIEQNMAAMCENNSFLVESVSGMATVKALAVEPQFNAKWEKLLAKAVHTAFNTATFQLIFGQVGDLFKHLSTLLILWYGGCMVISGQDGFTLGKLIAFQMIASQANATMLRLATLWPLVQQTGFNMEMMGRILDTRPEMIGQPVPAGQLPLQGGLAFEDVTYRYTNQPEPVLKQVSLAIASGQRIGIVGRSGSGKSTMTKLLQGLYVPEAGKVLLDGKDIREYEPLWLRQQIGVVLQENYLFSGSVRDNIAMTRPSANMDEVIAVAKKAGAHEFILELPDGYDTQVGEGGASLSGGQRQRLAVARALLPNPRILIFDEATSALDYESERIIMQSLEEIGKDRTVIQVAHRLTTVRRADLILVVEQGEIVERGSHEQLLEQRGIYHHLYMLQEGGNVA